MQGGRRRGPRQPITDAMQLPIAAVGTDAAMSTSARGEVARQLPHPLEGPLGFMAVESGDAGFETFDAEHALNDAAARDRTLAVFCVTMLR